MRRLNADEVKEIQIGILDVVASFCEKNQIKYWLNSGTLLGAVRHEGYIPWDDDIDIGMLREEYERFMKTFNKSNSRYRFLCFEDDDNYEYPYGKVIDSETVLYEPDKNGKKLSVNIDVFVVDAAPDDDETAKKMFDRRDRLRFRESFSRSKRVLPGESFPRKAVKCFFHFLYCRTPAKKYIKKMIDNSKQFYKQDKKRVGDFTGYARIVTDKTVFDSFIDVLFEGKEYKAPIGYDEWLTGIYGDYMQLPPEEKRVTHHKYEAYLLD